MAVRVKDVHYRNQKPRVFKVSENGLEVSLGFDVKTDQPVLVLRVPKVFHDADRLETIASSFAARKELVFSPFFLNYLGYSTKSHPHFNLFFSEYQPLRAISDVLAQARYRLTYDTRLFLFWARQVLQAFSDLLLKTRYTFKTPIGLKKIWLNESRTRLAKQSVHQ